MNDVPEKVLGGMLEAELYNLGLRYYHTYRSTRSPAGFPDYVIRVPVPPGEQLLFVELKKAGESPTPEQADWLRGMAAAGQVAILAGGMAGTSSVIDVLRGMRAGRRLMPTALGRVLVFGPVSRSALALVGADGAAAADGQAPPPPRTPDIRPETSGS